MFRTYGIKSVTMFDISRECGVSKKTVCEHFRDKEELVRMGCALLNRQEQHPEDFRQQSANAIEELLKEVEYEVMRVITTHFIFGVTTMKGRKLAAEYLILKKTNTTA